MGMVYHGFFLVEWHSLDSYMHNCNPKGNNWRSKNRKITKQRTNHDRRSRMREFVNHWNVYYMLASRLRAVGGIF